MPKLLDLTGERFGDLVVKAFSGKDKDKNRLWLCECACGNTVTVTTRYLRSWGRTNCGCKTTRKQALQNQKFGDLTVKEIIETSKWGDKLLLCECTCGNKVKVMSSLLKSGEKTNCGCKNQIFKDQKEKKETTKKEMVLKGITTTYDETKVTGCHKFTVCGDNFETPYRELDILAKKKLILQLTKEKLLKATKHSTLDLFLAFLTAWV